MVKAPTQTQLRKTISEDAGLAKKDVDAVFEALEKQIAKHLGAGGAGEITVLSGLKLKRKKVKARPAKKHIPHPFKKGEFYNRPAKAAHSKAAVSLGKLAR